MILTMMRLGMICKVKMNEVGIAVDDRISEGEPKSEEG